MKIIIPLLLSFSISFAKETVVPDIDLGLDDIDKVNYKIKATGDYPVYEITLTAGRSSVADADYYLSFTAYDICADQGDFVPRELGSSVKEGMTHIYKYDFKCELRDKTEWLAVIRQHCGGKREEYFEQICATLEKKHGKDLVTCKGKCPGGALVAWP